MGGGLVAVDVGRTEFCNAHVCFESLRRVRNIAYPHLTVIVGMSVNYFSIDLSTPSVLVFFLEYLIYAMHVFGQKAKC